MRQLRKLGDETGQAMTELALVMPILILLLFAIVEGGLTLNNYLRLTDAVRVGARIASINGSEGAAAAQSAAAGALSDSADGLALRGISVSAPQWQSGSPVTVTASTQYHITLPLLGQILSGTLTSSSTQRIE